ncbi:MAG TPA: hypothetical protein VFV75_11855 [Candidatus Polarisedimenticolaceae bacterium]|nr:hypothetical protein [Candidatus Polarisedimenticolaceae bacterium]
MAEFVDGAVYVCGCGPSPQDAGAPAPPRQLPRWLRRGWDVSRSLWDRNALLIDLDLEDVRFDAPCDVYLWPERAFRIQAPVTAAIRSLLAEHGIAPLHVLSGRGHHFVWSVPVQSRVFHALADLGRDAAGPGSQVPFAAWAGRPDPEREAAFLGAGMVLEHLAQEVIRWSPLEDVPLELTAVEPGAGRDGREVVSIDLSEYGDPLETRTLRIPFSPYLKAIRQLPELTTVLPELHAIPWEGHLEDGLAAMRSPEKVAALAAQSSCVIPSAPGDTERLLASYRGSSVAAAHRLFYGQRMHPPEAWGETYDRTELDALPGCARRVLGDADGALLTPAGIQLVVRVFLALGWHPRHVAGLIRSRWERSAETAPAWEVYSPARRADFYVRLFTSAIFTGLDTLVSLNCRSQGERGGCPSACARNLLEFRTSLLERRRHDRLAGRPVHGLFLPDRSPGLPGGDP